MKAVQIGRPAKATQDSTLAKERFRNLNYEIRFLKTMGISRYRHSGSQTAFWQGGMNRHCTQAVTERFWVINIYFRWLLRLIAQTPSTWAFRLMKPIEVEYWMGEAISGWQPRMMGRTHDGWGFGTWGKYFYTLLSFLFFSFFNFNFTFISFQFGMGFGQKPVG